MNINPYCQHIANRFVGLLRSRSFDQDDVALFFIISRDYTEQGSLIRELGDFLAHPEHRDRGLAWKSISESARHFAANWRKLIGSKGDDLPPPVKSLCNTDSILSEVSEVLDLLGIAMPSLTDGQKLLVARELLFCVAVLLDGFSLLIDGVAHPFQTSCKRDLELYIRYKVPDISGMAVSCTLPIIVVPDVDPSNMDWYRPYVRGKQLSGFIVRRNEKGDLHAVPYSQDLISCRSTTK